ncbi:hypothetical protein GXW82_43200 [Streptacidiphilus sp. 4-A2]|nr:hypothetical protein [Streptacidiphilus sp. 4-A2]
MGMLTAAAFAPNLVLPLLAAPFIDRMKERRSALILADLIRAGLLTLLFVAGLMHQLSLGLLWAVVLSVSACTMLSVLARSAYLPCLLPPDKLFARIPGSAAPTPSVR